MSMKEISEVLKIGYNTVKRKIAKYEIPKRSREEAVIKSFEKKHKEIGYKTTELNCPECSKLFKIKNSLLSRADKHSCSLSCCSKYYQKINPISPKNGKEFPCKNCGKIIYRTKSRIEKSSFYVCSNDCRAEWIKKSGLFAGEQNSRYASFNVSCYTCGKNVLSIPSDKTKRNYCSMNCMSLDYQQRMIGSSNPFWKGGWDDKYGPSWKRISTEVRTRDNFTCQRCFREKTELLGNELLHAHHIIPFRKFNGDMLNAHDKKNLVTLCSKCHPIVEKNGIDFEWKYTPEWIVQTTTHKKAAMET